MTDSQDPETEGPIYTSIGDYIKKMRTQKGLELEDIAKKTKINLTVLRELENNNLQKLPDKTYVKGFLKSIVREMGVDSSKALLLLEETYQNTPHKNERLGAIITNTWRDQNPLSPVNTPQKLAERPPTKDLLNPKVVTGPAAGHSSSENMVTSVSPLGDSFELILVALKNKIERNPIPFFITILIIIVLILFGLIPSFLWTEKGKQSSPEKKVYENKATTDSSPTESSPDIPTTSPLSAENKDNLLQTVALYQEDAFSQQTRLSQETSPKLILDGASKEKQIKENAKVVPKVDSPIDQQLDQDKNPLLEDKHVKNTAIVEGEEGSIDLRFTKMTAPNYRYAKTDLTENTQELIPEKYRTGLDFSKQNVFLLADGGDSWITYKVDKEPIKSFILKKGAMIFLQGNLLKIQLGNTRAIKSFYNNKLLFTPSVAGTKSLVFPPSSAERSYLIPLFVHHRGGKIITADEYQRKRKDYQITPRGEDTSPSIQNMKENSLPVIPPAR
jgi:cytoskeletal protein RodZ